MSWVSRTDVLARDHLLYPATPAAMITLKKRSPRSTTISSRTFGRPDREIRLAWQFFAGTFVALALNGIWSLLVGTSSFGGDEDDLVQGWEGVLRNLPAYVLLLVIASLSVWFATQGGVHGSQRARSAFLASLLILLFAMSSVTRDAAEVVMTTRAATTAWVIFGVDVVLVGGIDIIARQRIRRASGR